MYLLRMRGATSNVIRRKLRSSTTGQGLTALTSSSSGLIISTICDNEAAATTYTAAGSTIETITTLGTFATPTATKCRFKEVDAANHPGLYEFQFADARFAVSSAKTLRITISGVSGMIEQEIVVQLTTVDPDSAAFGLSLAKTTNLTGFNDIAATAVVSSGAITTNSGAVSLVTSLTNAPTAGDLTATMKGSVTAAATLSTPTVLLTAGTGTGQLDVTSGIAKANLVQVLGVAATSASLNDGTAQAGGSSTITLASAASATDNLYNGCLVSLNGGTGAGQARTITSYVSKVATVDRPWTTNPDSTSTYSVLPADGPAVDALGRVDLGKIAGSAAAATNQSQAAQAIVRGTVGASSSTTSIITSAISPAVGATGALVGRIVIFDAATTTTALRGQATNITAATTGGVLTVSTLVSAPASGDTFGVY